MNRKNQLAHKISAIVMPACLLSRGYSEKNTVTSWNTYFVRLYAVLLHGFMLSQLPGSRAVRANQAHGELLKP